MVTLKNKFQEQQLVQSFHRLRHVYLSMILKPNIYNPKHYNLCYGLDISLAFSLFGLMAKTNVKSS